MTGAERNGTGPAGTKIKICGLSRPCDIETVNALRACGAGPDYIGFVFVDWSSRCISVETAKELKKLLDVGCKAVGVFVDEKAEIVIGLLNSGLIDIAQLQGREDEDYIKRVKQLTGKPVIKAFSIKTKEDILAAKSSIADYVLLDSGKGGLGSSFDWRLIQDLKRPYFLAGGLNPQNVGEAIASLHPYAVDVSSGVETNHVKDRDKMTAFVKAVREADAADVAGTVSTADAKVVGAEEIFGTEFAVSAGLEGACAAEPVRAASAEFVAAADEAAAESENGNAAGTEGADRKEEEL